MQYAREAAPEALWEAAARGSASVEIEEGDGSSSNRSNDNLTEQDNDPPQTMTPGKAWRTRKPKFGKGFYFIVTRSK